MVISSSCLRGILLSLCIASYNVVAMETKKITPENDWSWKSWVVSGLAGAAIGFTTSSAAKTVSRNLSFLTDDKHCYDMCSSHNKEESYNNCTSYEGIEETIGDISIITRRLPFTAPVLQSADNAIAARLSTMTGNRIGASTFGTNLVETGAITAGKLIYDALPRDAAYSNHQPGLILANTAKNMVIGMVKSKVKKTMLNDAAAECTQNNIPHNPIIMKEAANIGGNFYCTADPKNGLQFHVNVIGLGLYAYDGYIEPFILGKIFGSKK